MKLYAKGRKVEYAYRNLLLNSGASLVVRSAGSKGLVDLVAFFPKEKIIQLIQVKKGKRRMSTQLIKRKYEELKKLSGNYKVVSRVVIKEDKGFRIVYL
jgi:hypothetical protein